MIRPVARLRVHAGRAIPRVWGDIPTLRAPRMWFVEYPDPWEQDCTLVAGFDEHQTALDWALVRGWERGL